MKKIATNKGVTLIALVITIIVLLILAGVTVSMVLGDEGIIAEANNSNESMKVGAIKEKVELAVLNNKSAKYNNGDVKTKNEIIQELLDEGMITQEDANNLKSGQNTLVFKDITIDFSEINESIPEGNVEKENFVTTEAELIEALSKGGNIVINADIELTNTVTFTGKTAVISSNNKTISIADGVSFDHMFKIGSENTTKDTNVVFKNIIIDAEATNRLMTIQKSAEVTIEDGAIFKNGKGTLGAGATVVGVLNLDGGSFENCKCLTGASPGGAIYMGGGTFNMSAGKITGCENYNYGSAVGFYWSGGVFNMSGGTIENCINSNNVEDGAVYLGHANAVAKVSGGKIINNSTHNENSYATGINTSKGTLELSGDVEIYNDTVAGLRVNTNPVKVKSALLAGTRITVSCSTVDKVIAIGDGYILTENDLNKFENVEDGYNLDLVNGQIVCVAE